MGDDDNNKTGSGKSALHPVYSVTNILHKVRMLDGVKVSYSAWVKLFTLHARGYKVLHHIDGTKPPAKTDPNYESWIEIDSHVLQWIYGTLPDDLLLRILETESTAYEAWTRLKNHFLNNKGARAAALETEFSQLSLASMPSLEEYCQKLKDLADQLNAVDSPVSDQRLVLKLVRGLTPEYDTVGSYINQTLPPFESARSMLQLEAHRQSARTEPSSSAVLAATSATSPDVDSWADNQDRPQQQQPTRPPARPYHNNDRRPPRNSGGRGQNFNGRNNRTNNNGRNYSNGRSYTAAPRPNGPSYSSWTPPPAWPTSWSQPPPCPYPTYPGWAPPWQPPPRQSQQVPQRQQAPFYDQTRTPAQAYAATGDGFEPTALGTVFNSMSLQDSNDAAWYMDTGATSHLTSESGYSDWDNPYAE